jgi:hypothetical protein
VRGAKCASTPPGKASATAPLRSCASQSPASHFLLDVCVSARNRDPAPNGEEGIGIAFKMRGLKGSRSVLIGTPVLSRFPWQYQTRMANFSGVPVGRRSTRLKEAEPCKPTAVAAGSR